PTPDRDLSKSLPAWRPEPASEGRPRHLLPPSDGGKCPEETTPPRAGRQHPLGQPIFPEPAGRFLFAPPAQLVSMHPSLPWPAPFPARLRPGFSYDGPESASGPVPPPGLRGPPAADSGARRLPLQASSSSLEGRIPRRLADTSEMRFPGR